jgi:uncharacterized metal-binding protein
MAMETKPKFVGVLSCSGEAEAEGTIARNAVRLVMEKYRPGITVSLCLPLYLAGDGGEREFAKKAPVIAVDGCDKACARLSTEKYSGKVRDAIDIRSLLREWGVEKELSPSHPGELEKELTEKVAQEIVKKIDALIESGDVVITPDRE